MLQPDQTVFSYELEFQRLQEKTRKHIKLVAECTAYSILVLGEEHGYRKAFISKKDSPEFVRIYKRHFLHRQL